MLRPDDHADRAPDAAAVIAPTTGARISYDGHAGGPALERDIIGWTRERLAHYKCPRSVTFVDSLPRSVAGKMMKHRLIEQLARS